MKTPASEDNIPAYIGGIIKSPLLQVSLKIKENNQFADAEVMPYIIHINSWENYPRATLTLADTIRDFDIGIELNGIKYHFDKKIQPSMGEMKTESGLYLPLAWNKYYAELTRESVPINGSPFHVMGLAGTLDKNPLYFMIKQPDGNSRFFSFMIHKGSLKCFEDFPKHGKLSYYLSNLSDSLLNERVKISRKNLEDKVEKERSRIFNIIPSHGSKLPAEAPNERENKSSIDWKNPKSTVKYLNQYIIGQDDAKKRVAIALKKYRARIETKDESIEKGNLLLIGPTGTGKTYMISLLAEAQDIPFVNVKTSAKSQTGYKGENLSSAILNQLLVKMKETEELNSNKIYEPAGIIFIDEFDKLGSDKYSPGDTFVKLQQEIIGWAENDNLNNDETKSPIINTKNLLFVGAGAFSRVEGKQESLSDIITGRMNLNKIGFKPNKENEKYPDSGNLMSLVSEADLEKYGLMPELIGRFTEKAVFNSLTTNQLGDIFCNVKNSVYFSYKKIIENDGYILEMDEEVPMIIAENCSKETGARAIRTISSDIFNEILYEPEKFADKKKIIKLTPELINNLLSLYRKEDKSSKSAISF